MKYAFSVLCFLFTVLGFTQIVFDSAAAQILIEVKKKDTSGKYIKRTFKDVSSGAIYEYEANPDKFSFEVQEDVVSYLRKTQRHFNEKQLNGNWKLDYISNFSGNKPDHFPENGLYKNLEFTTQTKLFTQNGYTNSTGFIGCYSLNKKSGIIHTLSTSDKSLVLFPTKEGNRLPEQCIKSDDYSEESLPIYTLNPDYLVLYKFIPHPDNDETEQTILLHYKKVQQ